MPETIKEKEPAAAGTATSSKDKISCKDNTTYIEKCQALMGDMRTAYLEIYAGMTEQEQRAWELGELYAMLRMAEGVLEDGTV